jgi:hypothetical protein
MSKRFSNTTARVLARSGVMLFWVGFAGLVLSVLWLIMFHQGNVVILGGSIASLLVGMYCRVLTERFGATYEGATVITQMFIATALSVLGVFLLANGIQYGGGAARPNWFGQECWDSTCYRPEWIALSAIALGGAYFLFRSVPQESPD